VNAEAAIAADQSLAEMAQRLEAALRRPKASEKPVEAQTSAPLVSAAPVAEPAPEEAAAVEAPAVPPPAPPLPRPVRPAEAKPTRFESKSDIKLDTKSKEGKLYEFVRASTRQNRINKIILGSPRPVTTVARQ
jgi:hypothetical protein